MLTVQAYAKINLTLEVLARRADGYHEITSILQTIDLADVLSFEPADEIEFVCRDTGPGRIELLENSILRAANLLRQETGCARGALIRMESMGIPRATGLGSSSTDPAAVLKGLNELWALGLSLDDLSQIASKIGSDTPFFIRGGTALAQGRGEIITPLPTPPPTWLVLLRPTIDPTPGKTAKMYRMLNTSHFTSGTSTQNLVNILKQKKALLSEMLYNSFERVVFDFFGQLDWYRTMFLDAGAESVHLAGAGPMLFALVKNKTDGEKLARQLRSKGIEVYLSRTL